MDLWDVAKVMWRRRWVAVPLLLLSVVAAVFALLTVPPDYTATGKIAVLPPSQATGGAKPGETTIINPYSVDTLAELEGLNLNRADIKRQMIAEGLSGDYEVTVKAFGLTVMELIVSAKSQEMVTKTLDRLISMVTTDFARYQATLKPGEAIRADVIDSGEEITVVRTVGKRTLIVIVGVGLLVTVAISLWVDALVRRRNLRLPDLPEARAVVPVSPAVGLASAAPPVVYSPNAATVSLADEGRDDNDSTIVLPLAGVAWSNASSKGQAGKRNSGDASGGAKAR